DFPSSTEFSGGSLRHGIFCDGGRALWTGGQAPGTNESVWAGLQYSTANTLRLRTLTNAITIAADGTWSWGVEGIFSWTTATLGAITGATVTNGSAVITADPGGKNGGSIPAATPITAGIDWGFNGSSHRTLRLRVFDQGTDPSVA